MFGIDWEGPVSICILGDVEQVEVPFISLHFSPQQFAELKQSVDPLEQCDPWSVTVCSSQCIYQSLFLKLLSIL